MRICFFTANPFGMFGTTGTFKLIEVASNIYETYTFSRQPIPDGTIYTPPDTLRITYYDYLAQRHYPDLVDKIRSFKPNIFYIFNYSEWPELSSSLASTFPKIPIFLDLQTPLLAEGQRREDIRSRGESAQRYITQICTYSKENVGTWINNPNVSYYEYPLGVDCDSIPKHYRNHVQRDGADWYHAIYFGSLNPKRKIDKLTLLLKNALSISKKNIILDLYGDKVSDEYREKIVSSSSCNLQINIKAPLPQTKLFHKLSEYDFGVAWVPTEKYSDSPSLKLIEMMASGIPVIASNTNAHQICVEGNTQIPLFDETGPSLSIALNVLTAQLSSYNAEINIRTSKNYSFKNIFIEHLAPLFSKEINRQLHVASAGKKGSNGIRKKESFYSIKTKSETERPDCPVLINYALILSFSKYDDKRLLKDYLRKAATVKSENNCIRYRKYLVSDHPKHLLENIKPDVFCPSQPIVLSRSLQKIYNTPISDLRKLFRCKYIIIDPDLVLERPGFQRLIGFAADTKLLKITSNNDRIVCIIDTNTISNTVDCHEVTPQYLLDGGKYTSIDIHFAEYLINDRQEIGTKWLPEKYRQQREKFFKFGLPLN